MVRPARLEGADHVSVTCPSPRAALKLVGAEMLGDVENGGADLCGPGAHDAGGIDGAALVVVGPASGQAGMHVGGRCQRISCAAVKL